MSSRLVFQFILGILALMGTCPVGWAQAGAPLLMNHQGKWVVNGYPFTGFGRFKFALITPHSSRPSVATATVISNAISGILIGDGGTGYVATRT